MVSDSTGKRESAHIAFYTHLQNMLPQFVGLENRNHCLRGQGIEQSAIVRVGLWRGRDLLCARQEISSGEKTAHPVTHPQTYFWCLT
jgi:hypothetical protein